MASPKPKGGTNRNLCRNQLVLRFPMADGTLRTVVIRDTIIPSDPYLKLVRAKLYSIKTGEVFQADLTDRTIKDALIKTNIQI